MNVHDRIVDRIRENDARKMIMNSLESEALEELDYFSSCPDTDALGTEEKYTVLLVEDNKLNQKIVETMLSRLGCEV
jgi:hypothetical protein